MNDILTPAQRFTAGIRARKQLARSEHATLNRAVCPAPPLDVLAKAEAGRIPKLVELKHQRMAESAFSFFRGAVPIMAADLAKHPHTGIFTQLCGDAHVLNLGAFASPEGRLVFDINDFDESMHGPFEWDLKRLATSLILAGRAAGIARSERNASVRTFVETYRRMMRQFAAMPVLEMARFQIHRMTATQPMKGIFAAASQATVQRTLDKLTELVPGMNGQRRFRTEQPVLWRVTGQEAKSVLASLEVYAQTLPPERRHFFSQYRAIDVAFKVVGTGSIGLRDYCVYFEACHLANGKVGKLASKFSRPGLDPLFLQIKEEPKSAYAPYLAADPHAPANQGHRVANGQRAMQFTSDSFLGYTTIEGRDFLVRQLNDHKAGLDLTKLSASGLDAYADLCGEIFARGHARSGDPIMIAAYLGDSDKFDRAIYAFAHEYANKTEDDWAALKESMTSSGDAPKSGSTAAEASRGESASKPKRSGPAKKSSKSPQAKTFSGPTSAATKRKGSVKQ